MEHSETYTLDSNDPRIAWTNCEADFIDAVHHKKVEAAILGSTPDHALETLIQREGVHSIMAHTAYSRSVKIDPGGVVHMEARFEAALEQHIAQRALIMSQLAKADHLRLTFGNLRDEKFHEHFCHTFTEAVIGEGTDWTKWYDTPDGTVPNGSGFLMKPGFRHRSHPVTADEPRWVFAFSFEA